MFGWLRRIEIIEVFVEVLNGVDRMVLGLKWGENVIRVRGEVRDRFKELEIL